MAYSSMDRFADWSTEWDSDAVQNSLKASAAYTKDNKFAEDYAGLEEDGSSRVDDGDDWRELAFDDPPKTAAEYEELVNDWSSAGYDVRAIDMGDNYMHSNIAVRPGSFGAGDETAPVDTTGPSYNEVAPTLSPQIAGAIERTSSYRDRAWSGQMAQDVYGKSNSLAEGNTLGIPVNAIRGGEPNTNQALRAADSETARYFDPEKFKLDLKNQVQQTIREKFT